MAEDQTRTRILAVVGATEIASLVAAILLLIDPAQRAALFGPLILVGAFSSLVLGITATVATGFFRTTAETRRRDVRLTVVLLLLAFVSVPLVIGIASFFGLTGA